jgi:hypothetical protein
MLYREMIAVCSQIHTKHINTPCRQNAQFLVNVQQFYVLPTQCICVFCVDFRKKQRLFPYTALTDWFV